MNTTEAGEYWKQNAEAWTVLARAGHDLYRDKLNTPAFLEILPDINGLTGIDIGCGEGHNTRLLAQRGATMCGIDIAPVFIQHAVATEAATPLTIQYKVASATSLPYADSHFDFATSLYVFHGFPGYSSRASRSVSYFKTRRLFTIFHSSSLLFHSASKKSSQQPGCYLRL